MKIACDFNSFGFLGNNGCGKTTILRSICLALTRMTESDQTLANMLRLGATSGRIVVHFRLDEKPGILDCKIQNRGKSLKRTLKWPDEADTKEISNAAEIDAWVVGHLGCDRKSIMEAAFPAQGQLEQLLFGDKASREDLLIKILNMSFCETRARTLDGKIQALSRQITDIGPMIDQARIRKEQAETDLRDSTRKLEETPDYSEEISRVERMLAYTDSVSQKEADISRLNTTRRQKAAELETVLKRAGHTTIQELIDAIGSLQQDVRKLNTLRQAVQAYDYSKKTYDRVKKDLESQQAELAKDEETLKALEPYTQVDVAVLEEKRAKGARYAELVRLIPETEEKLINIKRSLEALVPVSEEDINSLRAREHVLKVEMQALRNQMSFQQCVLKGDKEFGAGGQCPDCGLRVDSQAMAMVEDKTQLEQSVATLTSLLEDKTAQQKTLEQDLGTAVQNLSVYTRDKTALESKQTQLREQLEVQQKELEELRDYANLDTKALEEEINTSRQKSASARHLQTETIPAGRRRVEMLQKEVADATAALAEKPDTDKTAAALDAEIDGMQTRIRAAESAKTNANNLQTTLTYTDESNRQVQEKIHADYADLADLKRISSWGHMPHDTWQGVLLNLKNQQVSRSTAQGEVNQMKKQLEREAGELDKLLTQAEANQGKTALIEELREVKAMLHKTGLPLTYAAYKFDQLLAMTGDFLAQMGARFEIVKDEDVPLAFRFRKFDDDEAGYLPMFDMSGGERVRTSVAFFLAVQQALLPQLGFMTLDEPSTHVDQEGKEAMVELLRNLNTSILGETRQLFLIDHDPMFKEALEGFVQLKSKDQE